MISLSSTDSLAYLAMVPRFSRRVDTELSSGGGSFLGRGGSLGLRSSSSKESLSRHLRWRISRAEVSNLRGLRLDRCELGV